ncbi:hypothetical protein [uncultured Erythrobacter sp.]|uniref:hypothetical protein n=1 Tax=uncultured Erythrobacter sp. TaxID=263913 RepID=UPI0026313B2C|nr:hypothetical protein [uncultured Erythrobacter sp.]
MVIGLTSLALMAIADVPTEVHLQDRHVRLSDLAVITTGHNDPIIAQVPRGSSRLELDQNAAHQLIRNRLPMAAVTLAFKNSVVLVAPAASTLRRPSQCFVASNPIAEGEFVTASLVAEAPCENGGAAEIVGYDRQALAPVARQTIASGTYLGPIRPAREQRLAKGKEVLLVTGAGPVTITRTVTTMQTAREGSNVFIRTSDGEVFPAPVSHIVEVQDK